MQGRFDFEWLTIDHIKSGECSGWLRVEIHGLELREGVNGEYIRVTYRSLDDCSNRWKFSHNYFGINEGDNKETNLLGQVTGLDLLPGHNMHKLIGRRLEIQIDVVPREDKEYLDVINHRELIENKALRAG